MSWLLKAVKFSFSIITTSFRWFANQLDSSGSPEKRRRNRIILFILVGFFSIATTAHFIFEGSRTQIPIANNLLVLFLLNLNIILLIVIGTLVGRNLVKLYTERNKKNVGTRFRTRLIVSFLTFTLIPSLLLFIVASGLITNAIDNWFNETVEKSLKESLEVAETFYKSSEEAIAVKSSKLAKVIKTKRMLAKSNRPFLRKVVLETFDGYGVSRIIVFDSNFKEVENASVGNKDIDISKDIYNRKLAELEQGDVVTETETSHGVSKVFSIAPIIIEKNGKDKLVGTVFVADLIDRSVVEKINDITKTFDEYRQLKLQQFPIKAVYEVTLLMVMLIVLFAAVWYGFYLAREITVPIHLLADATENVTKGDLSVRLEVKANDEIGFLINSFNRMTEQLDVSRSKLESNHKELVEINLEVDRRRKYIETILARIATGVISIDNRGKVTTFNPAAKKILNMKLGEPLGRYYEDIFDPVHLEPIRALMRDMGKSDAESQEKEVKVVLDDVKRTLFVHVSTLRDVSGKFLGIAVVFDDLTAMINAQKTSAWREIAQYMAHEIKNPLTPIKLNTERLIKQFKQDKGTFKKIFENSTRVIIQEVDGLKTLVDEFRKFGQLPEAKPSMVSLKKVVSDVVGMYKDIQKNINIKLDFDPAIGNISLDAEQMHRVFRNLVENAIDAVDEKGEVEITACLSEDGKTVFVDVMDDGPGVDPKNIEKLFLPYFSTKTKGTGLGLAIVNRIISDHGGHVKAKNRTPSGTVISIDLPA